MDYYCYLRKMNKTINEIKMGCGVFKSSILQILLFVEWKCKTVKPLI